MISVSSLARGHASFWTGIAPWLNAYTAHVNKASIKRICPPIEIRDASEFRAINNTIAFFKFEENLAGILKNESLDAAIGRAYSFLKNLPRNNVDRYLMSVSDKEIINIQVERLVKQYADSAPLISPYFPGCGVLLSSEGDLHYGDTLVEIKAGERDLQAPDIKQLLIYAALNAQTESPLLINKIEFFNPRQGIIFSAGLDDLCSDISDISKEEMFSEICFYGENIALTSC